MYLALDGIYHPLNAPLPRSATHGSSPYAKACDTHTGFSPGATLFPRKLNTAALLAEQLEITIRGANPDFHGELVPLQSPLLRES